MTDDMDRDVREMVDSLMEDDTAPLAPLFRKALTNMCVRMKAAGREQGLREAAAKCLEVSGWIGAAHGSSIDSALREASTAITALIEGEGK